MNIQNKQPSRPLNYSVILCESRAESLRRKSNSAFFHSYTPERPQLETSSVQQCANFLFNYDSVDVLLNFKRVCLSRNEYLLSSSFIFACPSARRSAASNEQLFIKFYIVDIYENLQQKTLNLVKI